jgi:hypothetical protein
LGFGFNAWGLQGHVSSVTYFSNLLEDKDRRFKTNLTLSLILRCQPKAQRLLHTECEFNRTPYKRRLDNYSGHEHLTASMQPRNYLEDTFKMEFRELEDPFRNTWKPTVLDYEELGGLSDLGPRYCAHGVHILG